MKDKEKEMNTLVSRVNIVDYIENTTKPLAYDFYKGDFKAYARNLMQIQTDYTADMTSLFNKYFTQSGFKDKQNIAYRIEQAIKACRFLKMGYFGFDYAASGFYHVLCLQLIEDKFVKENKKEKRKGGIISDYSLEDFDAIKLMSYFYN
ncbi:TPA: hypothetical protein ACQ2HY_003312 [Klebsiella pneumoniae]